jgi:hypothetical protein
MNGLNESGSFSHFGVETGGDFCKVRACSCGAFYVTIGGVTLKLEESAFHSVLRTFEQLLEDRMKIN